MNIKITQAFRFHSVGPVFVSSITSTRGVPQVLTLFSSNIHDKNDDICSIVHISYSNRGIYEAHILCRKNNREKKNKIATQCVGERDSSGHSRDLFSMVWNVNVNHEYVCDRYLLYTVQKSGDYLHLFSLYQTYGLRIRIIPSNLFYSAIYSRIWSLINMSIEFTFHFSNAVQWRIWAETNNNHCML